MILLEIAAAITKSRWIYVTYMKEERQEGSPNKLVEAVRVGLSNRYIVAAVHSRTHVFISFSAPSRFVLNHLGFGVSLAVRQHAFQSPHEKKQRMTAQQVEKERKSGMPSRRARKKAERGGGNATAPRRLGLGGRGRGVSVLLDKGRGRGEGAGKKGRGRPKGSKTRWGRGQEGGDEVGEEDEVEVKEEEEEEEEWSMTSYFNIDREVRWQLLKSLMNKKKGAEKGYKEIIVDRPKTEIEKGHQGKLDRRKVARVETMKGAMNKALDFARFGDEDELETVEGELRSYLHHSKAK
jgi:hypothetical protein